MNDSSDHRFGRRISESTPVSAARSIEHFSAAHVGDDVVLYDDSTMVYHTLNASAFAVWQLCDGIRTSSDIAAALIRSGNSLPVEAVELAVAELGEAGLLESASGTWNTRINRRRVVKMAASGVLGAAVIPAVSSMTAPSALASHTCGPFGTVSAGEHCVCSSECTSSCCCSAGGATTCLSQSNCAFISGGTCLGG